MRKYPYWKSITLTSLLAIFLLPGCTGQGDSAQEGQELPKTEAPATETTPSTEESYAFVATKNTTRVIGADVEQISISTSQMIWPASPNGTRPNVVLLAPEDNWQAQLLATDLIHHPSDGPLLITERDNVSEEVMKEIQRLAPPGASDGTQIITIGMDEKTNEQLSGQYKVKSIGGEDTNELAFAVDSFYGEVSGSLPPSVIVSSSEAPEYSIPAGSWISHMPEPLLFVVKDEVPDKTKEALQKRNGNARIYLLGPETVVSKNIEEELSQYGQVTRIAGDDPISNAIAFAKYKDMNTGFGWGITNPGHGFVLSDVKKVKEAIPAVSFAHRGKHGPLLLTESNEPPEMLLNYLGELKPLFKNDPTEGPYNHLYIIGNQDWISVDQQGDLDHLIEIEAESGGGHGDMHQGNGHMNH